MTMMMMVIVTVLVRAMIMISITTIITVFNTTDLKNVAILKSAHDIRRTKMNKICLIKVHVNMPLQTHVSPECSRKCQWILAKYDT